MNLILFPQSEDFLYWDPEEICRYPQPPGTEDACFGPDRKQVTYHRAPGSESDP